MCYEYVILEVAIFFIVKKFKDRCYLMKKIVSSIVILSLLVVLLAGCSNGASDNGTTERRGNITFAQAGWDSVQFHNAVAGVIAEGAFGYTWSEVPGSTTVLLEGVATGEVDIQIETWTDNLATYDEDIASDRFQELGVNYDDNRQGIYVPRYVIEGDEERGIEAVAPDLQYVWDLKDYPEVFQDDENPDMGRLYGSIPGWEVDDIMYNKYQHYGLDENFIYFRPGSESALSAAITGAYDRGEPIATYYWEPTWLLGLYDMVLLEDEPFNEDTYMDGETELPTVRITVIASNDFADDETNADYVEFLSKYSTSSELTSEGLGYMQENDADYVEAAKWFLETYDEFLDEWLNEEDAEAMRSYLNN